MHRTLLLAALLTGCGGTSPPDTADTPAPDTNAADLPAVTDATPMPSPDTDATPEALVVSTNEPFWQARIDGDTLMLTGAGVEERRLSVSSSVATGDGREVSARDAGGTVEAVVSKRPCEDDMSGARFPMTGTLTIDGVGPIRGCARPASMPPPGEPGDDMAVTASIPEPWRGRWAPTQEACRNPDSSIEGITISADGVGVVRARAAVGWYRRR